MEIQERQNRMSNAVIEHDPIQREALSVTPLTLIQLAVEKGANVEQLEKLFQLQLAWEKNESRKAYTVAMNKFKERPPHITKTKAVNFGQGKASYKHATLDDVSGIIGAALSEVGISHRWETEQLEGGTIRVTCVLTHSQGHSERTPLQASPDQSGSKNAIQAVGSTVSYLQRYTLLSATGMAVQDQDDDGRLGKKMADGAKADWLSAIDILDNEEDAAKLWQQIATATEKAGDIPAHEELRAAMTAKRRALKGPK